MKMKLCEVFMVIFITLIIRIKNDFPVHCERDNIVGDWKLHFTNFYQVVKNDEITCGNNNSLKDKISSKMSLDILDSKVVSLNKDFTALLKDSKKYYLGKWNMIGDQGLMIKFVEYEMITFFSFKINTKLENSYSDLLSFCYKTLPGIAANISNKITKKACFYGEKIVDNVNEEFIFKDTETYYDYFNILTNSKCFDSKKLSGITGITVNKDILSQSLNQNSKEGGAIRRAENVKSSIDQKLKKNENNILIKLLDNIQASQTLEDKNLRHLNSMYFMKSRRNDKKIDNKLNLLDKNSRISISLINTMPKPVSDLSDSTYKISNININKSIRLEKLNYFYLIDNIIFNSDDGKSYVKKYYIETNPYLYRCNLNYSNITSVLLMLSMRLKFMYNLSKKFSISHVSDCNYISIKGIPTHPIFTLYFMNENYLKTESNEQISSNINDSLEDSKANTSTNCNLTNNKKLLKNFHNIDDYGFIPNNVIAIEEELISKGPIVCGVQITNDFYNLFIKDKSNAESKLQNILTESTSWKKEGRNQPYYTRSQLHLVILGFDFFIDNNSKKIPYWIILNPFYNNESYPIYELFIPKGFDYFRIESDCIFGNLKPPN